MSITLPDFKDFGADNTLFPPIGDLIVAVRSGSALWLVLIKVVELRRLLLAIVKSADIEDTLATSSGWQKEKVTFLASEASMFSLDTTAQGIENENEVEVVWSGAEVTDVNDSMLVDWRVNPGYCTVEASDSCDIFIVSCDKDWGLFWLNLKVGIVFIGNALLWEAKKAGRGSGSWSKFDLEKCLESPSLGFIFPPVLFKLSLIWKGCVETLGLLTGLDQSPEKN